MKAAIILTPRNSRGRNYYQSTTTKDNETFLMSKGKKTAALAACGFGASTDSRAGALVTAPMPPTDDSPVNRPSLKHRWAKTCLGLLTASFSQGNRLKGLIQGYFWFANLLLLGWERIGLGL